MSNQFDNHTVDAAVVTDPRRRVPVENADERPHGKVDITSIGKGVGRHLIDLIVDENETAVRRDLYPVTAEIDYYLAPSDIAEYPRVQDSDQITA